MRDYKVSRNRRERIHFKYCSFSASSENVLHIFLCDATNDMNAKQNNKCMAGPTHWPMLLGLLLSHSLSLRVYNHVLR